jgi:hypothetical protein
MPTTLTGARDWPIAYTRMAKGTLKAGKTPVNAIWKDEIGNSFI